jgi:hypothetical protein
MVVGVRAALSMCWCSCMRTGLDVQGGNGWWHGGAIFGSLWA